MAIDLVTELALRQRFRGVLMSAACQQINFYWGALHVDGSAFSFIALALASQSPNGIGVDVNPTPHPGRRASAAYNSRLNKIIVPHANFPTNAFETNTIVHEATHAIQDVMLPNGMLKQLNEVSAFVAAALFNIYSAPDISGPYPFTPKPGDIFDVAHQTAMPLVDNPGMRLMPEAASPLRKAILAHPTFAFEPGQIQTDLHNGVSL
jgi:hypothetical protein